MAASARQYLQHGCFGYLAYVVDTRFEVKNSVLDVLVVKDFLDAFSEDLLGLLLMRWVEFRIDLILGADPYSK